MAVAWNDGIGESHTRTFFEDTLSALRTVLVLLSAVDTSTAFALASIHGTRGGSKFASITAIIETDNTTVAVASSVGAVPLAVADTAVGDRALESAVGSIGVIVLESAAITCGAGPVSTNGVGEAFTDRLGSIRGIRFAVAVSGARGRSRAGDVAEIETESGGGGSISDLT